MVAMDLNKTMAAQKWPQPGTVHWVWGFLGFAGYYRCFITTFARIAPHLDQLLVETKETHLDRRGSGHLKS